MRKAVHLTAERTYERDELGLRRIKERRLKDGPQRDTPASPRPAQEPRSGCRVGPELTLTRV